MNLVIEKGVTCVVIGKVDVVVEGASAVVIAGWRLGAAVVGGMVQVEPVGAGRR